jgi:Amt family ammonium transporter
MVLAMHSGFAFRLAQCAGRTKSMRCENPQRFAVSTIAYFSSVTASFTAWFPTAAEQLAQKNGYELVRFFFF